MVAFDLGFVSRAIPCPWYAPSVHRHNLRERPMPTFGKMSINKARARSATDKRAAQLQEYMAYIQ